MHAPTGLNPQGSGKGPFGERGFRLGLGLCVMALAGGAAMLGLGGGAIADIGLALVVIAPVALVTAGLLLLVERRLGRRPPEN
jgi:hypothetical protein